MISERARIFRSPLRAVFADRSPVAATLRHAAADPDRPAIVDADTGERVSRGELAARSAALAAGLAERGIGRGDAVAVAMPNLARWPVVALGVWRAGAALVPLSPRWTAEEMGRPLALVRPRLVVVSRPLVASVLQALSVARIAADVVVGDEGEGAGGDAFAEGQPAADDLAAVLFSSGTAGPPKGVCLSHSNLSAGAARIVSVLACTGAFDAGSVALAGAPFFHAMGLGGSLCAPLTAGAQIVTQPVLETERLVELIAEHRVTHAIVAPPIVEDIAAAPTVERYDTSSLRFVVTAGTHVPAAVQLRAGERLGCVVRQGYGLTEASPLGVPSDRPSDPHTVGWLPADTEARLVDPDNGRDVAPGRPGELWVRGPQVMRGYYDDARATAAAFGEGWLRTGDLVTIRDDGQLVIAGRLEELIKVGGAAVAPAELELVLREHAAVRDAAVVGRPHARHGEVPVAYVVLDAPATPDELSRHVDLRVASHKHLHDVQIVDELPRLPSGKLARGALRGVHP